MTFLKVWVGYAIFGTAVFSAFFVWAVRARQFSNLGRGGYIPLEGEESSADDRKPTRIDRYTWAGLAAITIGLLGLGLWLGLRSG